MSIGSFSTSLSGLNANQQELSVIGNNLANINTVGFKASTTEFSDLVSQSVGGTSEDPMQVGLGVATASITPNFTQGDIENTGIPTNVALQGTGFFIIGGTGNEEYTRAGDFSFNSTGQLVNSSGQPVQGYTAVDPATGQIVTTGQPSNIVIPPGVLQAPVATTSFSTESNLNAQASVGDTFTASAQVYDSLGVSHVVTINYTNTAPGAWSYTMTVPGSDVKGGTAGTPSEIGSGTVSFDSNGNLLDVNGAAAANVAITAPTWADGAKATNFTWQLINANGGGMLTGYASASATSSITQNGDATGSVSSVISVDENGNIIASFGEGQTVTVGQLAIASFNNPGGLVKLGDNNYSESAASGIPSVGAAGSGGRGTIIGAALEQSNVDIANEFTQMILAQRGYQANSKSITVADELLVDTLNIIR